MGSTLEVCQALARLLEHPERGFHRRAGRAAALVRTAVPGACMDRFLEFVGATPLDGLQEHYARTFEVNPQCCLEVGWQVYGEQYHRGSFLVWMRERLREHGIPEGTELPDHLGLVLQVLGRLDGEDGDALVAHMVVPAVKRMLVGLSANENPYEQVLDAILKAFSPRRVPGREVLAHA